jgi:hypothetical protein
MLVVTELYVCPTCTVGGVGVIGTAVEKYIM